MMLIWDSKSSISSRILFLSSNTNTRVCIVPVPYNVMCARNDINMRAPHHCFLPFLDVLPLLFPENSTPQTLHFHSLPFSVIFRLPQLGQFFFRTIFKLFLYFSLALTQKIKLLSSVNIL